MKPLWRSSLVAGAGRAPLQRECAHLWACGVYRGVIVTLQADNQRLHASRGLQAQ